MTQKIVIASGNRGKLREFAALFAGSNIAIIGQDELGVPEAVEDGLSFIENAIIKARNASRHTDLPAIADDSGLAVDYLQGEPGIYSARYSCDRHGEAVSDERNNQKLLDRLQGVQPSQRGARFICALAYVQNAIDPVPITALGEWRGVILNEPRGENGFGYDPLFFLPEHNCSSAELEPALKNAISHRGQALKKLVAELGDRGILSA